MLACDQCGTSYAPDDVDVTLGIAHCSGCGTVSELRTRTRPQDRPVAPRPASSRWRDDEATPLELVLPWRDLSLFFMLFFTVFWNGGIMVMIGGIAVTDGIMAALPMLAVPHVWVGMGLMYYVVASLLNDTVIAQDGDTLTVQHGPVPWFGNRSIPLSDIDQLYVERSSVRVNKQPRWNLCAMGKDGVGQTLVRMLRSESEGRWLEDRIERALAIEDKPVAGEVDK